MTTRSTAKVARAEPVPDRRYITVAQAAARYGVSDMTIRRHVWDGSIPAIRIGRTVRLDPDQLDELFAGGA
jgi:excisionase family DNA binding protein